MAGWDNEHGKAAWSVGSGGANSAANHLWHSPWALEGLRLLFQRGKNGIPFQACLSHMGNGSVLLLSSFPEFKRVVGASRWGKGGSILNCHCLQGTQGSGEIKHGQCDTNKQTNKQRGSSTALKNKKKALEGQGCWQKCFRDIFAPLPIIEPERTLAIGQQVTGTNRSFSRVMDAVEGQEEQD